MASVGQRIAEQYPYLRFLVNDPQVGRLLRRAVDLETPYSEQRFMAALMKTRWWRRRSDTQRQAQILRATKPGEYKRQIRAYRAQLAQQAAIWGIQIPQKALLKYSRRWYAMGFDPTGPEVMHRFRLLIDQHRGWATSGLRRTSARAAQQLARGQYLYMMSNKHAAIWGERIASGTATLDDVKTAVADQAIRRYPQFAKGLKAGYTMADLTDNYRQIIAEELEIDPENIDLANGRWSKMLGVRDSKGKVRPMTNFEALKMVRQDPRWWRTGHARQMDAQGANWILGIMGRRAPVQNGGF